MSVGLKKANPLRFRDQYFVNYAKHLPKITATEIAPLIGIVNGHKNVVIDVGANIGNWCKAWMDVFGNRTSAYHLCEPLEINTAQIKQRISDGIFDDCGITVSRIMHLHKTAIGEQPGTIDIHFTPEDTGLSSAAHSTSQLMGRSVDLTKMENVPITTIDTLLSQQNIQTVDMLKIDTEGFELNVLRGAKEAMRERRIKNIAFEFGLHQLSQRHTLRDFWDIFDQFGYEVYRFGLGVPGRGWGLTKLPRYAAGFEELNTINFFLARATGPN